MTRNLVLLAGCTVVLVFGASEPRPTFSKDVAPILQNRCQGCHRPGEAGPMPLLTYSQARPWAKAIRSAVLTKKMPPWFADRGVGHFRNDTSLTQQEIDTLVAWIDSGAPEGNSQDLPAPREYADGWNIGKPDLVLEMPTTYQIPAKGTIDIVYLTIPTGLTEDTWIQAAEIRPGNRVLVHHVNAIVQKRAAGSPAAEPAPAPAVTVANTTDENPTKAPAPVRILRGQPTSEFLVGYVPGYQWKSWQPGQGKLIPAGSNIILQIHYSTNGTAGTDRTKVGLVFAREPVKERVLSAVAKSWDFEIPAGATNHEVVSSVKFASDVKLVSFHPHMHYRGKNFEYKAIYPTGETEVLMRVPHWDFNWQMTYFLKEPKILPKGTRIVCTAHYDNSANNPFNPNPSVKVIYGEQTWDEMMSGWVEVAFEPDREPRSVFDETLTAAAK